jgi:hypothetical protein
MDAETQDRVVLLIAKWYTEKHPKSEIEEKKISYRDTWGPKKKFPLDYEIPTLLEEINSRVAEKEECSFQFSRLKLCIQSLKSGVGGIANERDLEYMAELNKLEPTYSGYEIGRDLGDDNQIGKVISDATPKNQKKLPPGTLRKIFQEVSERFVR